MKTDYNQFKEEGLSIVDEDGVPFENKFENEAIHQEMDDLNINHATELAIARWEREKEKQDLEDYYAANRRHYPHSKYFQGQLGPEIFI
jgi:hypothetical protein